MKSNCKNRSIIRDKENGRMFVLENNRRHWILTIEAAEKFHLSLDAYTECNVEELKQIPVGSPVVYYPDTLEECRNCTEARAFLTKELSGLGIECGPGSSSNCYPLPLNVDVKYLDRFDYNEGCNQDYSGEFPLIDYKTTINELDGIKDNSLDFIVHCHVIEHSRNPLQALELAYQKLKPGGQLIMAVPDKRYTFDKPRKITKVKHLIEDYRIGMDSRRDLEHVHCCKKIWIGSGYKMIHEMTDEEVMQYLDENIIDIHWHTYTDRSFKKLLKRAKNIVPWKQSKVIPIKKFKYKKEFIEFYILLKK